MRRLIKKICNNIREDYIFYKRTVAFKKRYKNLPISLFNNPLEKNTIQQYIDQWSVFGKKVEIDTFLLSYNLSGKVDFNIVPENIFAVLIEKKLNPFKEASFYEVKNIYEKWFDDKIFPYSYIHKMNGIYYDHDFKFIDDPKTFISNMDVSYPLILKSSRDTFGGKDVIKLKSSSELLSAIEKFDFFTCQELINQNILLNEINSSSINTVRTCLYRTKNGTFDVINNSIRFGVNGSLDNETSGGIVCNINDDGKLNDYAVDKHAQKFYKHPDSDLQFNDIVMPYFSELNDLAISIANQVFMSNLVSLDMCLDSENRWRCIEVNMFGQTIRFAQYAGKGFFGQYTKDVINSAIDN